MMHKREFLQRLLGVGAAMAVPSVSLATPRVTRSTHAVRGLEAHCIHCPNCLNVFALLKWPGHEGESGNNVRYVGTWQEVLDGAEVECACGTVVFVKPFTATE